MSLIDWSDPEEMLGLLVEYIRDELIEEQSDRRRAAFLRALASSVESVAREAAAEPRNVLAKLRSVAEVQPAEFAGDPVLVHVDDCVEELARIATASAGPNRPTRYPPST